MTFHESEGVTSERMVPRFRTAGHDGDVAQTGAELAEIGQIGQIQIGRVQPGRLQQRKRSEWWRVTSCNNQHNHSLIIQTVLNYKVLRLAYWLVSLLAIKLARVRQRFCIVNSNSNSIIIITMSISIILTSNLKMNRLNHNLIDYIYHQFPHTFRPVLTHFYLGYLVEFEVSTGF